MDELDEELFIEDGEDEDTTTTAGSSTSSTEDWVVRVDGDYQPPADIMLWAPLYPDIAVAAAAAPAVAVVAAGTGGAAAGAATAGAAAEGAAAPAAPKVRRAKRTQVQGEPRFKCSVVLPSGQVCGEGTEFGVAMLREMNSATVGMCEKHHDERVPIVARDGTCYFYCTKGHHFLSREVLDGFKTCAKCRNKVEFNAPVVMVRLNDAGMCTTFRPTVVTLSNLVHDGFSDLQCYVTNNCYHAFGIPAAAVAPVSQPNTWSILLPDPTVPNPACPGIMPWFRIISTVEDSVRCWIRSGDTTVASPQQPFIIFRLDRESTPPPSVRKRIAAASDMEDAVASARQKRRMASTSEPTDKVLDKLGVSGEERDIAATWGSFVELCLGCGVPQSQVIHYVRSSSGLTLLSLAVLANAERLVAWLLRSGADPLQWTPYGTPLDMSRTPATHPRIAQLVQVYARGRQTPVTYLIPTPLDLANTACQLIVDLSSAPADMTPVGPQTPATRATALGFISLPTDRTYSIRGFTSPASSPDSMRK